MTRAEKLKAITATVKVMTEPYDLGEVHAEVENSWPFRNVGNRPQAVHEKHLVIRVRLESTIKKEAPGEREDEGE